MAPRLRVFFLIPSLVAHGAERQLCELVKHLEPERFELHVATYYRPEGGQGVDFWSEVAAVPGLTLHCLDKTRGAAGYLQALPRLFGLLRRISPDILHGYMDCNLPLLLAGALLRLPVVWGIRRTSLDMGTLDRLSRWVLRVMAFLSRFADLVIFNSQAGRGNHEVLGFRGRSHLVIPNGFDTARFRPLPEAGMEFRRLWGVDSEAPLFGIVGRFHPVKDHPTFLEAAARIRSRCPGARFVCIGDGSPSAQARLQAQAASLGLEESLTWAGAIQRMPEAYNALTALLLTSVDEGFPNVVGEAMACGVPCVVTRVGDAAVLVGETGFVVPVGDPEAIASAALQLAEGTPEARRARSLACRARICEHFTTLILAQRTGDALSALVRRP